MAQKFIAIIMAVSIIGLLVACIGLPVPAVPTNTPVPTPTPFPNRLDVKVDIGGHVLPLSCLGSGEPTIILENGIMHVRSSSITWRDSALLRFSQSSRTCRYLRVGQNGDELTQTRTTEDQVKDLHDLLTQAGVPKPYILVGHSIAGLNMVLFTSHYPDEVAGFVCVDCVPPSYPLDLPGTNIEALDVTKSLALAQKVTNLGDLPLVVLVAEGTPDSYKGWLTESETLSKLSTRGRLEVVPGTDHWTIVANILVDNAVKEVLQATRK